MVNQPLLNLSLWPLVQAEKLNHQAIGEDYRQQEQDMIVELLSTYYEVLRLMKVVDELTKAVVLIDQRLVEIQRTVEIGYSDQQQVLDWQMEKYSYQRDIFDYSQELTLTQKSLHRLMGQVNGDIDYQWEKLHALFLDQDIPHLANLDVDEVVKRRKDVRSLTLSQDSMKQQRKKFGDGAVANI